MGDLFTNTDEFVVFVVVVDDDADADDADCVAWLLTIARRRLKRSPRMVQAIVRRSVFDPGAGDAGAVVACPQRLRDQGQVHRCTCENEYHLRISHTVYNTIFVKYEMR